MALLLCASNGEEMASLDAVSLFSTYTWPRGGATSKRQGNQNQALWQRLSNFCRGILREESKVRKLHPAVAAPYILRRICEITISGSTTHQLLLLHRADHDGTSLRVGGQVLPWNDPTAASLAVCLDVHRLQLRAREGEGEEWNISPRPTPGTSGPNTNTSPLMLWSAAFVHTAVHTTLCMIREVVGPCRDQRHTHQLSVDH